MNLVFNKSTLKVISIFDNNIWADDISVLKSMFPVDFQKLSIWSIKLDVHYPIPHLRITLDSDGDPNELFFKDKSVYKISKEDKEKSLVKFSEQKRELLEKSLSRSLIRSLTNDMIKLWLTSPRTDPYIKKSLQNLDYFIEKPAVPISWWGPFTDAGGYANMNREILFRLHNHHIIAKAEICPTAPQISQINRFYISKYNSIDLSRLRKYTKIWSFTPIPHPLHSGRNIFFTMMETETLHPEFVRICNTCANEVWVPSSHNKRVFEESGVRKPIFTMPLGIDELLYNDSAMGELGVVDKTGFVDLLGKPFAKGVNSFKFLSLFGWSYRKGIDVLIKSFVEQFKAEDDVALIIISRHSGSPAQDHVNVIKADVERFAYPIRRNNFPQILLFPHVIPEQDMPSFYRMGNAFIHLSRGEGFSLPQIEAAACGLPVISCNNTGMSEYLRDDNSFMVETDEKEICNQEMHWITSYYHNQLFPKLGRNQIDQAKRHMIYVVNNYKKAILKGSILRKDVFDKYTWKIAANRVAQRIQEISR